jgi:SAM-dependent methyltransferase
MTPWRAALVRLLGGAGRPLQGAATALSYLAAGSLTRADLDEAIARLWDDLGAADDAEVAGLLAWESAFYLPALKPGERVLLVGCGTGRDLVALLDKGYAAEGLDLAPRAIEACRGRLARLGLRAPLHVGSIEHVALDSSFDAVVFSWLCYDYIPEARSRVEALRNARRQLAPGGRVLLSYVPRDKGAGRAAARVARVAAALARSGWSPEPGDLLLVSRRDGRLAVHYEHHFASQEIEREVREAGLTVVEHTVAGHGRLVLSHPPV